jgi:hypothetical protein
MFSFYFIMKSDKQTRIGGQSSWTSGEICFRYQNQGTGPKDQNRTRDRREQDRIADQIKKICIRKTKQAKGSRRQIRKETKGREVENYSLQTKQRAR